MKFRITYTNSFKELKTIVIESDTYFDAIHLANSMFGKSIVNIEEIDKPPMPSKFEINEFNDDVYDWLAD